MFINQPISRGLMRRIDSVEVSKRVFLFSRLFCRSALTKVPMLLNTPQHCSSALNNKNSRLNLGTMTVELKVSAEGRQKSAQTLRGGLSIVYLLGRLIFLVTFCKNKQTNREAQDLTWAVELDRRRPRAPRSCRCASRPAPPSSLRLLHLQTASLTRSLALLVYSKQVRAGRFCLLWPFFIRGKRTLIQWYAAPPPQTLTSEVCV